MKKTVLFFIFFIFFFFLKTSPAFAQNKAGINIGDRYGDFDRAAGIVGAGGWVVIMVCPGDGDKISQMINSHPEVNIIIRGHYYASTPDSKLAGLWAATLASIPTPNRIYFMPWNEPNQIGSDDYTSPSTLVKYISDLKIAFTPLGSKIFLLSPMINITHANYEGYIDQILKISPDFFTQFEGISFNLYDMCNGECSDPHQNPIYSPQLLGKLKAGGKKIFGVEAGTMGVFPYHYFDQPASSSSPLYKFVNNFLTSSPAEISMIGIPSYDLGGERDHTWSLFDPPHVTDLLKKFPKGVPLGSNGLMTTLPGFFLCPNKQYAFYKDSQNDCYECGSGSTACKPIKEPNDPGKELSKNFVNIPEEAKYDYRDDKCITATFNGQTTLNNFKIPFAKSANQYFLGLFVDSPKTRMELPEETDPFNVSGVLEKLTSEGFQSDLKVDFLSEIIARGNKSRYVNFNIEGKNKTDIKNTYLIIKDKIEKKLPLSKEENDFLDLIWPQIPLFANEESEGEVVFWASGINGENNKIKTSVPEVYRLNKVTKLIRQMFPEGSGESQTIQSVAKNFTPTNVCPVTISVPGQTNPKKSMSGTGNLICTSQEIQTVTNTFAGTRTFENDANKKCKGLSGCELRPGETTVVDRCCGNNGKCAIDQNGDAYCNEIGCNSCWGGYSDMEGCCAIDDEEITKQFTDTDLNSENQVPYLNEIAENTVGDGGLFRIFLAGKPENEISSLKGDIDRAFEEVAGESNAELSVNINKPVSVNSGVTFNIENVNSSVKLLFHKLGTLINAKNFISSVALWPKGEFGNTQPLDQGNVPANLKALFEQISASTGVPAKIIEAIMQAENPSTFSIPKETLDRYLAGEIMGSCTKNTCSEMGPMQMTTGVGPANDPTCLKCCNPKCLTACPNAWASWGGGGNPCVLRDAVTAAARMLKNSSGSSSSNWTKEEVYRASESYHGSCKNKYSHLGNRTYCEFVWDYYQL